MAQWGVEMKMVGVETEYLQLHAGVSFGSLEEGTMYVLDNSILENQQQVTVVFYVAEKHLYKTHKYASFVSSEEM